MACYSTQISSNNCRSGILVTTLTQGLYTCDSLMTLPQRFSQRGGGMNKGSVFCKHHNGCISCDSTSTRASFVAIYLWAEVGALDINKLELQESLCFVQDAMLCNLCSTSCGGMGYHNKVQNVLKPQGSRLYKQSGHIPRDMQAHTIWLVPSQKMGRGRGYSPLFRRHSLISLTVSHFFHTHTHTHTLTHVPLSLHAARNQ